MLYFSLTGSALLLLAVNVAARLKSRPVLATPLAGTVLAAGCLCVMFPPALVLQGILLCVLGPVWRWSGKGPGVFTALSLAVSVAAYVPSFWSAVEMRSNQNRLRDVFPFESHDGRVPLIPPHPDQPSPFDSDRLDQLDRAVDEGGAGLRWRELQLQSLHERQVRDFANSPGFGVTRMRPSPTRESVRQGLRNAPAPSQPSAPDRYAPTADAPPPPAPDRSALGSLHAAGVLDFVHPAGFGYVKDRGHVAGFQPHGFSKIPGPAGRWEVARVELVSLLLHDPPAVYLTDRLPSMEEIRSVPVRPLDAAEADGLTSLRRGDELIVGDERVVGAVRNGKRCATCHDGERGDLLGAFVYTLRPAPVSR